MLDLSVLRPRRLVALLLLAGMLLAIPLARPAAAHVSLVDSDPGYRDVIETSPDTITLSFSGIIESVLVRVRIEDEEGNELAVPELTTEPGPTDTVSFAVPDTLPEGVYAARWNVFAFDGHLMQGIVPFAVGDPANDPWAAPAATPSPGASPAAGEATAPPVEDYTEEQAGSAAAGPSALTVQLKFLLYAALALATGALFWLAAPIANPKYRVLVHRHAAKLLRPAAASLGVVALARGLNSAASAFRATLEFGGELTRPVVTAILTSTQVWAWVLSLGLAAVAWVIIGKDPRREDGSVEPRVWWTLATVTGAVSVLAASTSHAASDAVPMISTIFQAIHLVAAVLWIGPILVYIGLRYRSYWTDAPLPGRSRSIVEAWQAFGTLALWSIGALVITGVRSAIAYADGIPTGAYMRMLIIKLAVTAVILVPLGAWHHLKVGSRKANEPARSVGSEMFKHTTMLEVGGFALVLLIAAALSSTSPT